MNRNPIFLRVDATNATGYERLARNLVLAAALQRRRRPVYFLSRLEPNGLAMTIKRGANNWLAMNHAVATAADLEETMRHIRQLQPAAIFVDDAGATHDYLAELVAAGLTVLSIDHLAAASLPSHVIVNPLLGPSKENYEFQPRAQLLFGRRYTLVRPEIRRQRPTRAQEPAPLAAMVDGKPSGQFRALVALGEDDPNRQTIQLAKLLLSAPRIGKVDVIVRREHPQLEAIKSLVADHPGRLELALEPAEIAARLVRCHFAVTAGTGWSNELACIGVPQLVIVQNEQHWPNAQRLEEEGCASCLGWHENVSAATLRTAVHNLLTDPLERQAMARCGRKLIDGRGPDRLVNAMEIVLAGAARRTVVPLAA
ncbi:MAG: polysaccharide biosynthesis protein [Gemmataceae bacterium]|nr:polysaccharide biosynthesis protein [Gemmataceae bacterium]